MLPQHPQPARPLLEQIQFGSMQTEDVLAVLDAAAVTRIFPSGTLWLSSAAVAPAPDAASDALLQPGSAVAVPAPPLLPAAAALPPPCAAPPPPVAPPPKQPMSMSWASVARPKAAPVACTAAPDPADNAFAISYAHTVTSPTGLAGPGIISRRASVSAPAVAFANDFQQYVSTFTISFGARPLRPRGLINNGNMCFLNVILQPLLHCAPFFTLMKSLAQHIQHVPQSKKPLTRAMIVFFNEFEEDKSVSAPTPAIANGMKNGKQAKAARRTNSDAFEPTYIYDVLSSMKHVDSVKGRQEDAEEFLGFLLDGLHEELVADSVLSPPTSPTGSVSKFNDTSEWIEVGPKQKNIARMTEIRKSPITQIFGGNMRSVLKAPGDKDSVKIEPFMTLQLDIEPENIRSIEDALMSFSEPETISGYTSEKLKTKVEASKQSTLDDCPATLILHLKRFKYDNVNGVARKLRKHISFGATLRIQSGMVSPQARKNAQRLEYRLFAVVNHHGVVADGGHYTSDVMRANQEWLRIDDEYYETIDISEVMKERSDRQPYMLFYAKV